jgi:hypothetical protein
MRRASWLPRCTGQAGVTRERQDRPMKNKLTLTAGVTLGALLTAASLGNVEAAPQISAQSIIVNPVPTTVNVRVWTDRDASGTQTPNYYPGENIRLYTSVSQDSYVYLFNVDPQGQAGQNSFAPVSPTAQGPERLAQALSIVVNPVPQNTWDSATAFYNVAQGNVAPVRPVPVQPVQPAPVRPIPVQPVQPGYTVGVTRSSFSSNRSLADVNNEYVNRLRNEGLTLISSRQTGNHIRSEFQGRRGTASLEVKQRGNRFDVTITRR